MSQQSRMTEASSPFLNLSGLSVIITNYNGRELLERCLPSVEAAARRYRGETEIILVDDCSTDGSQVYIQDHFPKIKILVPERNLGFQEASNFGFRQAKFPIIISLNNDIEVTPECFEQFAAHFSSGDIFAVSTKVFMWDRVTYLAGRRIGIYRHGHFKLHDSAEDGAVTPTLFATGGACACHREKLMELGGFDPIFHPLYWEDIDLCYRAWKRGWKVLYDPNIVLYHKHRATIETLVAPEKLKRITARNSYLFLWKNLNLKALPVHFFFALLFLLRDLLLGRWRFPISFGMAVARLPQVVSARRREKPHWRMTDDDVLSAQSGN